MIPDDIYFKNQYSSVLQEAERPVAQENSQEMKMFCNLNLCSLLHHFHNGNAVLNPD